MNPKPTMDAMVHLWGKLDFEQRVKLLDQAMFPRIQRLLNRAIRREAENTFITPLNDNDVGSRLDD